jgi:HTH-type transcriptional regulator/antitoxin HigA
MDIAPIKTQHEYRNALKEIEGLMTAKRNTPEGDRLHVLVTLVEAWERKHYRFDLPDPVEAIKSRTGFNCVTSFPSSAGATGSTRFSIADAR